MEWRLDVEYPGTPGSDLVDREVTKAAGEKWAVGSGFDLQTHVRDLQFVFPTRQEADAAAVRVKAARVKGLTCKVHMPKEPTA